jgi:predicted transposase YdaD
MTKKAYIGSKRLISLSPDNWARWLTGQIDLSVTEFLSSEFPWVSRSSDVLLKVHSPRYGDFLLLNEIQLRYSNRMPRQMRTYTALAEERYDLPVYPVLINILPARQDFPSHPLRSELPRNPSRSRLSGDQPFGNGGGNRFPRKAFHPPALRAYTKRGRKRGNRSRRPIRADEQLRDLEPLLSFFASFVLEILLVQEIMRWDMTVLRESPWYQEILTEGLQQGIEQGIERGQQQGEASLIIRQLTRRFGSLSPDTLDRIRSLPIAQLDELGDNLLDFTTLDALHLWLSRLAG